MIASFRSIFLLLLLLFTSIPAIADDTTDVEDGTCEFDDGIEYTQGENLGTSFESRCGDGIEWPCFCAPDSPFQAFCPYCGFSSGDGSLYCARDGQTISFPDGSITRICSCEFTGNVAIDPVRNCTTQGGPVEGGQCILPDAEGELIEFDNGESFGNIIDGACGSASEWPSFCRVLDEDGNFDIAYPYCVFNDVSFDESSSGILCSRDGETIIYIDENEVEQTCSCTVSPEGDAFDQCTQAPTVAPEPTSPTPRPEQQL
ncbi:MAG: hypothetical protein SGARI_001616 [Bacillariaceae sp.]